MKRKWYYLKEGRGYGPVTANQLAELLRTGKVHTETPVRSHALEGWRPLEDVPELEEVCMTASKPPPLPSKPPSLPTERTHKTQKSGPIREEKDQVTADLMTRASVVLSLLVAVLLVAQFFGGSLETGNPASKSSLSEQKNSQNKSLSAVPKAAEVSSVSKPEEADAVLRGQYMSYAWWFDSDTWTVTPGVKQWHPVAEYGLHSKAKGVGALVVPERTYVPTKHLRRFGLQNVREGVPNAEIVSAAWQRVNGKVMLDLTIEGTTQDMAPMTWRSYSYSAEQFGTVRLIAFVGQNLYDEQKAAIEELLSGLVITGEQ